MDKEQKVKKMIPSRLERGFQTLLYKTVGKHIPAGMTPNQMTLVGALAGLAAAICVLLTRLSPWFFTGAITGTLLHLIADDLDGYIARSRGMASDSGAYFDLVTDILFSTFLLTALGFSPYAKLELAVFLVPLYGIINITSLYNILYYGEFPFPRIGPIEAHLCYIAVFLGGLVWGMEPLLTAGGVPLLFADVVMILGGIPMLYEMFRMQIALFRRLRKDGR